MKIALSVLSQQYRVPSVDLAAYIIDPADLATVPKELCERLTAIAPAGEIMEASARYYGP